MDERQASQFGSIMDDSDEESAEGFEDDTPTADAGQMPVSLADVYTCCVCGAGVTLESTESRFFICGEYSCSGEPHFVIPYCRVQFAD